MMLYLVLTKVQWKKIDAQLCSVLWQSVDPKILLHLWAYKTCSKFWNQAKALIPCEERKNREFLILLFPQENESSDYITY